MLKCMDECSSDDNDDVDDGKYGIFSFRMCSDPSWWWGWSSTNAHNLKPVFASLLYSWHWKMTYANPPNFFLALALYLSPVYMWLQPLCMQFHRTDHTSQNRFFMVILDGCWLASTDLVCNVVHIELYREICVCQFNISDGNNRIELQLFGRNFVCDRMAAVKLLCIQGISGPFSIFHSSIEYLKYMYTNMVQVCTTSAKFRPI